jgi:hypothetical protein
MFLLKNFLVLPVSYHFMNLPLMLYSLDTDTVSFVSFCLLFFFSLSFCPCLLSPNKTSTFFITAKKISYYSHIHTKMYECQTCYLAFSRQVEMLCVSCDGWSFSGLAWTFKFSKFSTQRPAYGLLGHLPFAGTSLRPTYDLIEQ